MIRSIKIALLLIFAGGVLAAEESLNIYLESAARNNPELKSAFYQYSAALEMVPQAGTLPDPMFSFGYFIRPVQTRNGPQEARISISQKFPWFGTLKGREHAAVQEAHSRYESFEALKSKLFFKVRATYYEIYFVRKQKKILREKIENIESLKELIRVRRETGRASGVDELKISMMLDELRVGVKSLEDQDKKLFVFFSNAINNKDTLTLTYPETLPVTVLRESHSELWHKILAGNHTIRSREYHADALIYLERVAKKQGFPQITIGVDYGVIGATQNPADNPGRDVLTFPSLGITLPLNRKKYRAVEAEAVLNRKAAEEKVMDQSLDLQNRFEDAYRQYTDAERRVTLFASLIQQSEITLRMLKNEYSSGKGDFEEVLQMERQQLDYILTLEKAKRDQRTAVANIQYLKGE